MTWNAKGTLDVRGRSRWSLEPWSSSGVGYVILAVIYGDQWQRQHPRSVPSERRIVPWQLSKFQWPRHVNGILMSMNMSDLIINCVQIVACMTEFEIPQEQACIR